MSAMLCVPESDALPESLDAWPDGGGPGGGPDGRLACIVLSKAVFSSALTEPSPFVSILLNISSAFDVSDVDEVDEVDDVPSDFDDAKLSNSALLILPSPSLSPLSAAAALCLSVSLCNGSLCRCCRC